MTIETLRPIFARKPLTLNRLASITQQNIILTRSGREISMPPAVRITSNRVCKADIVKMSQWLIHEAIEEALYREDDFNLVHFQNTNPKKMSASDYDIANEYLFGVTDIIYLPAQ
jgi:hypothetical protein